MIKTKTLMTGENTKIRKFCKITKSKMNPLIQNLRWNPKNN
jgi:hypothetical protein